VICGHKMRTRREDDSQAAADDASPAPTTDMPSVGSGKDVEDVVDGTAAQNRIPAAEPFNGSIDASMMRGFRDLLRSM